MYIAVSRARVVLLKTEEPHCLHHSITWAWQHLQQGQAGYIRRCLVKRRGRRGRGRDKDLRVTRGRSFLFLSYWNSKPNPNLILVCLLVSSFNLNFLCLNFIKKNSRAFCLF